MMNKILRTEKSLTNNSDLVLWEQAKLIPSFKSKRHWCHTEETLYINYSCSQKKVAIVRNDYYLTWVKLRKDIKDYRSGFPS